MIDIFADMKKKGALYELITEGHNWCICWCEKEVCPTIKVWGESPDRSSPNKVRACGCSHNSFYCLAALLYFYRYISSFCCCYAKQVIFWWVSNLKDGCKSVHSKFSRQGSWRSSMNVVLFEITATVSSNSALHQANGGYFYRQAKSGWHGDLNIRKLAGHVTLVTTWWWAD